MTRARSAFSELDSGIRRLVKFSDGSVVKIEERSTILFISKGGEHRKLTDVYFILRLKANLVSLGQLDEVGCFISIECRLLKICDDGQRLLTQVRRTTNCLYILELEIEQPISLSGKVRALKLSCSRITTEGEDGARFAGNQRREQVVRRVPHWQTEAHPFPSRTSYCADEPLELVHGDIYGPIKPTTPGGKTLLLLLVDDKSRFMWLILLQAKSEAAEVVKRIQARAEVECGSCAQTRAENSPQQVR